MSKKTQYSGVFDDDDSTEPFEPFRGVATIIGEIQSVAYNLRDTASSINMTFGGDMTKPSKDCVSVSAGKAEGEIPLPVRLEAILNILRESYDLQQESGQIIRG